MSLAAEPDETVPRLPPWTEEAALAYLRERREVRGSQTWLGEQWGWPKQKVNRYLEKWLKHKFVRFRGAGQKRMVVYLKGAPSGDVVGPPTPLPPANDPKPPVPAREVTARVRDAAPPRPMTVPVAPAVTVAPPVPEPDPVPLEAPVPRGVTATSTVTIPVKLLALLIFLIGAAFAAGPLWLTPTSWYGFAATASPVAGMFMAVFGFLIAALGTVGLAAASHARTKGDAAFFRVAWVFAIMVEAATAVGFMYANIGSAVGSREAVIDERARVTERLAALENERDSTPKFDRVSQAQVAVATAARARECQRGGQCTKAIADEKRLGADMTRTARADEIKVELAALETQRKVLPFLAAADPLITGLIEVVTWVSAGSWAPSERAIRNIRLLIFAFAPALLPGPLIAGALGLVRRF